MVAISGHTTASPPHVLRPIPSGGFSRRPARPVRFPPAQPPRKSGAKGCVLAAVGGVVLLLVACCVAGWLGWSYVKGEAGRKIAEQLQHTPAMQENIGEISSIDVDIMKTGTLTQQAQADDPQKQVMSFNVQGSKGSGELIVEMRKSGNEFEILKAELKMSDGRTVPVAP